MQGSIFFSRLLVVAIDVCTGDIPAAGEADLLENDGIVGVNGGGGGGVSAIIAEVLDPKLDAMECVGTYLIEQKYNPNSQEQFLI